MLVLVAGSYLSFYILWKDAFEILCGIVFPSFTVNVFAIAFLSRNNLVSSKLGFLLENFYLIFPFT